MHLIFISLVQIDSLDDRGIYHDLMRVFRNEGHSVTVICPVERRSKLRTRLIVQGSFSVLQVRTLNVQKTNLIEKGLATITLNFLFKRAIKKYLSYVCFDMILYTTPPITLTGIISYLKRKNKAKTYLLLKDIFPQNAVDMKMIKEGSLLHSYFSWKEKKLYQLSDRIGCMSPANVAFIQSHHPEIPQSKLEVNYNSIEPRSVEFKRTDRKPVLDEFHIPEHKVIFLYGGNLGKPQGLSFLLEIITASSASCPDAYFVIVGDGTEYRYLKNWFNRFSPSNASLIQKLPREQYNDLASHCNVGLILLHPDFTIPNFPSRLLGYLESKMPVLSITDPVSDIGPISEENHFGKWCLNGDLQKAIELITYFTLNRDTRIQMGENGYDYFVKNYDVRLSYNKVIGLFEQE